MNPSNHSRPAFNWRLLAATGALALLLVLWIKPGDARPAQWSGDTPVAAADTAAPATPARLSVLDLGGKFGLAVLLFYCLSFGLSQVRRLGLGGSLLPAGPPGHTQRLQIHETIALGKLGSALHLVEIDGHPLLIGATADQLFTLWQAPAETTSSFQPVRADEPVVEPQPSRSSTAFDQPLFQRGFGQPTRRESDWAQQRSQLISALMRSE